MSDMQKDCNKNRTGKVIIKIEIVNVDGERVNSSRLPEK